MIILRAATSLSLISFERDVSMLVNECISFLSLKLCNKHSINRKSNEPIEEFNELDKRKREEVGAWEEVTVYEQHWN